MKTLKDKLGNRLVAFGRFAGIVGAYNGLMTYGKRYNKFSIRRAHECFDINDLKIELRKSSIASIENRTYRRRAVWRRVPWRPWIRQVSARFSAEDFLHKNFEVAVYTQLSSAEYHTRKEGGSF
jgi:saccharopine dehydrogenase (NAD+, L-lysine-forming)